MRHLPEALTVARQHDEPYNDLAGVDLSKLNLDHIELDRYQGGPSTLGRLFLLAVLLAMGGFVLWFPNSDIYLSMGPTNWLFFLLATVGTVVGVAASRIAWQMLEEASQRWAKFYDPERTARAKEPQKPASALTRFFVFVLVASGAGGILFGLPAMGYGPDQAGGSVWFGAAIVAIIVGFVAGRWLLMQAEADAKNQPKLEPIKLPPWFKWVTLTVLIGAATVALVLSNSEETTGDNNSRFGIGGVGLVVGIATAIWLTRRFDEAEAKIKAKQAQRLPRPPPETA